MHRTGLDILLDCCVVNDWSVQLSFYDPHIKTHTLVALLHNDFVPNFSTGYEKTFVLYQTTAPSLSGKSSTFRGTQTPQAHFWPGFLWCGLFITPQIHICCPGSPFCHCTLLPCRSLRQPSSLMLEAQLPFLSVLLRIFSILPSLDFQSFLFNVSQFLYLLHYP